MAKAEPRLVGLDPRSVRARELAEKLQKGKYTLVHFASTLYGESLARIGDRVYYISSEGVTEVGSLEELVAHVKKMLEKARIVYMA